MVWQPPSPLPPSLPFPLSPWQAQPLKAQRLKTVLTLHSQLLNSHWFITNCSKWDPIKKKKKKKNTTKEPFLGEKPRQSAYSFLFLQKQGTEQQNPLHTNLPLPKGNVTKDHTAAKWLIHIKHRARSPLLALDWLQGCEMAARPSWNISLPPLQRGPLAHQPQHFGVALSKQKVSGGKLLPALRAEGVQNRAFSPNKSLVCAWTQDPAVSFFPPACSTEALP